MKKNYIILAIIAGALLGALQLQAKGLLGENYLEVNSGLERARSGDLHFSGWGAGVVLNCKLIEAKTDHYGLDWKFDMSYANLSAHDADAIRNDLCGSLVMFDFVSENIKPFISGTIGMNWVRGKYLDNNVTPNEWINYHDSPMNSYVMKVAAGMEMGAGYNFTITPYVNYEDFEKFADASGFDWGFGINGSYWITERINTGLDVSYGAKSKHFKAIASFRYGF